MVKFFLWLCGYSLIYVLIEKGVMQNVVDCIFGEDAYIIFSGASTVEIIVVLFMIFCSVGFIASRGIKWR